MAILDRTLSTIIEAAATIRSLIEYIAGTRKQVPTQGVHVTWGSGSPSASTVLQEAEHSVLLLGTSNFRIVHDEMFVLREWLDANPHRVVGMLFLSPFSPHAYKRGRLEVPRSSQDNIIHSLKQVYNHPERHQRLVPCVYDGPYRYSARAIDIGEDHRSRSSKIRLFTSSHTRGISGGFTISLTPGSCTEAYEYYKGELLSVWRSAVANPPGHGLSIITRGDAPSASKLAAELADHLRGAGYRDVLEGIHVFTSTQLHLTWVSLCRTQPCFLDGPLSIRSGDLPSHYGEFLTEVIDYATGPLMAMQATEYTMRRVILNEGGHLILMGDSDAVDTTGKGIAEHIRNLVGKYATRYPDEDWTSSRCAPKHAEFRPHIAIGMAFEKTAALPKPLVAERVQGRAAGMEILLHKPVVFRVTGSVIAHYAYRSYQRTVGEIPLTDTPAANLGPDAIMSALGVLV